MHNQHGTKQGFSECHCFSCSRPRLCSLVLAANSSRLAGAQVDTNVLQCTQSTALGAGGRDELMTMTDSGRCRTSARLSWLQTPQNVQEPKSAINRLQRTESPSMVAGGRDKSMTVTQDIDCCAHLCSFVLAADGADFVAGDLWVRGQAPLRLPQVVVLRGALPAARLQAVGRARIPVELIGRFYLLACFACLALCDRPVRCTVHRQNERHSTTFLLHF